MKSRNHDETLNESTLNILLQSTSPSKIKIVKTKMSPVKTDPVVDVPSEPTFDL